MTICKIMKTVYLDKFSKCYKISANNCPEITKSGVKIIEVMCSNDSVQSVYRILNNKRSSGKLLGYASSKYF